MQCGVCVSELGMLECHSFLWWGSLHDLGGLHVYEVRIASMHVSCVPGVHVYARVHECWCLSLGHLHCVMPLTGAATCLGRM